MLTNMEEASTYMEQRSRFGIKPGLFRMHYMLEKTGHPEKRLQAVHIAGTNGKGSTSAYLTEILLESGYKTGSFTSPSLEGLHGHIKLNNQPISDQAFIDTLNRLLPAIDRLDEQNDHPTFFEILVMVAIMYFAETTDIAVVETGMGGKEDSTNCLMPILSIITNIEKDHEKFLGKSYAEIAAHKAGIIKPAVPVIIGDVRKGALQVVEAKAQANNAPLYCYGKDFHMMNNHLTERNEEGFTMHVDGYGELDWVVGMKGIHQASNAALVIQAIPLLEKSGFILPVEKVCQGLKNVQLPGRLERVHSHPSIIIDGAHNEKGMQAFLASIERYYPTCEKHLLFAAFQDKATDKMIQKLDNMFSRVIFTSFEHERAAQAKELYTLSSHPGRRMVADWRDAISIVKENDKNDRLIFIAGSLTFIGIVRSYLLADH